MNQLKGSKMSDQVKRDKQAVIDAVVGGDLDSLAPALKRLSGSSPYDFVVAAGALLNTEQREQYLTLGVFVGSSHMPDFFHAEGVVYGAIYVDGSPFCKRACPVGTGLPIAEVRVIVEAARQEYDNSVLERVTKLKEQFEQMDRLLAGHSFADSKLVSLAHVELVKGQALLIAAIAK
jgi:hypothetical protein